MTVFTEWDMGCPMKNNTRIAGKTDLKKRNNGKKKKLFSDDYTAEIIRAAVSIAQNKTSCGEQYICAVLFSRTV